MAFFGGKSLVDSVDEIIHLVTNWNVMHCKPHNTRSMSKKRAHPCSILDNMIATPAKKTKLNCAPKNSELNCLFNLEKEARHKLCELALEAVRTLYNTQLEEKEERDYVYSQLSRPKHGRGEIALLCFRLCKPLKAKPNKIAEDIVSFISKAIDENSGVLFLSNPFKKVEAANGRINAYLTASYIAQIIPKILNKEKDSFLNSLPLNGERVMVEYSQPNTHKAFHVGHMRNVALGDCLVRLCTHCGYDTVSANYFGDEGAHVAKCIWWIQKGIKEDRLDLDEIEKKESNLGEYLGNKYAEAVAALTLSTYTRFPFIGVIVAKVISISKHPKNIKNWNVVEVEYVLNGENKVSTVVCGGTQYNVDNLIAYVPIGCKYKDKVAERKDMKGVISEGVIMGCAELGIINIDEEKENKKKKKKDNKIYIVDKEYKNAKMGDTLVEIGAYPLYAECDSVQELWSSYVSEQENVLKLLESGNVEMVNLWMRTRKWSLDEFCKIYEWLNVRFDHDFFESELSESSRKLVDEYFAKGIFVKSEGAIGIRLDDEGLGFCMLLKSNGSGLYATKDLSLARKKFEEFNIDRSIYVVDATQSHHFKQVFATLNRMGYTQSSKCYHLPYSFVRLAEGKMATRTGNVILFSKLVSLLAEEVNGSYLNKLSGWNDAELKEAERAISVGAIKYGMLNHDNNKEIIFDLKEWTLSSGNTGPYLMYQYARISSIARKVEFPKNINCKNIDYSVLQDCDIVKQILFELSQFQTKIKQICDDKSPSQLCDYLYSICKLFSKWYSKPQNSIIKCDDDHLKAVRLQFCEAVAQTIKVGIQLLGITPLDRM